MGTIQKPQQNAVKFLVFILLQADETMYLLFIFTAVNT